MVYNRYKKMKKAVLLLVLLMGTMKGWCDPNFLFSDTTSTGQVLYYNINNGNAELVAPWTNGAGSVGWNDYAKPVGTLIIPDSVTYNNTTYAVTSIAFAAFCFCREMTSVIIPESITSIAANAFHLCDALITLDVPSSVTSIGNGAFNWVCMVNYTGTATGQPWGALCLNGYLEDSIYYTNPSKDTLAAVYPYIAATVIDIPPTVSYIGKNALNSMSSLTAISIPSSVVAIDEYAFAYCTGLTEITSYGEVAPLIQSNTFTDVPSSIPVNIPCGSIMSYYSRWNYFSNFIEDEGFSFSAVSENDDMGTVQILTQPTCTAPTAVVYAEPNSGYHFSHWSNGTTANPYTLTVSQDTSLVAYFVSSEGIDDVEFNDINVYQQDGTIVVEGAEPAEVNVYNIMGCRMIMHHVMDGRLVFNVTATGTYIVKVGNYPARKVMIIR